MAITFDPAAKRIILDSAATSEREIWSRWSDWAATSDNAKYLPALSQEGGNVIRTGIYQSIYIYLENGWRIRPMEAHHTLIISGYISVRGSDDPPVVNTLGTYNVSVQYTVAMQAQALAISGSSGPSASQIAAAVHQYVIESGFSFEQLMRLQMAMLANKITGAGTDTETFWSMDGTTPRIVMPVDQFGNRSTPARDGT